MKYKKIFTVKEVAELAAVADYVLSLYQANDRAFVITLSGDLGAGKTTFTQTLAKLLGVSEIVTSPTFVVQSQYETSRSDVAQLVHIDAYRIDDIAETKPLRLIETFNQPQTIVCIEWPERIREVLPEEIVTLTFSLAGEVRHITVETPE